MITNSMNYKIQTACHPSDVKHYDTERLRNAFLMEKVLSPDEINLTYTMYDRFIYGGAMPVNETLVLETFDDLKAGHFLDRRELGVINVGGDGVVTVDGTEYPMHFKEALYVGCGKKEVTFRSADPQCPAKFYINSAPAYKEYVTQLIQPTGLLIQASTRSLIRKDMADRRVATTVSSTSSSCIRFSRESKEEEPISSRWDLRNCSQALYGIQCLPTLTQGVWRHISTSMSLREMPCAISWASLRNRDLSGCITSRPSLLRNGPSIQQQEQATICSFGECAVRTSIMQTRTRYLTWK